MIMIKCIQLNTQDLQAHKHPIPVLEHPEGSICAEFLHMLFCMYHTNVNSFHQAS